MLEKNYNSKESTLLSLRALRSNPSSTLQAGEL